MDLPENQKKYPYISTEENDVDSLVVEEVFSSNEFQTWLLKKLSLKGSAKFIGAWKNVRPSHYGECDIVIEFNIDNKKTAILIEDKIDAPEQPQQAERYHKTGKYLIETKKETERIDQYVTCLLSPEIYYKEDAPMGKYEKKISYEEMLKWFESQIETERMKFKKMVLKNGIKKARTGYTQPTDERTDAFYKYYVDVSRENNPKLGLRYKQRASRNNWVDIKPTTFPSNIIIKHKGDRGYVDLEISKIDIDEFTKSMEDKLEDKMQIEKTGKSLSVRIDTLCLLPEFNTIDSPETYRDDLILIFNTAEKLMNWYSKFKHESIFNIP